jgi:geranylgeranyl pyrophosphate synthase
MVGGQILDMENEGAVIDVRRIELTYALKTGALISAACEAGCVLAGANDKQREAAVAYAKAIGLAFQITDDILNYSGDEKVIGKPVGSDADRGKMTYVEALGVKGCE